MRLTGLQRRFASEVTLFCFFRANLRILQPEAEMAIRTVGKLRLADINFAPLVLNRNIIKKNY